MSLDNIGKKFGTDKSSELHDYLRHYEELLRGFSGKPFTLVELGVGPTNNMGKSLLTWHEYFPKATVVGVDIRADAIEVQKEGILIEIGDCGNEEFLDYIGRKYTPHVVIDDASHKWSHQILSFEHLFPHIQQGGIFIVEDLETSFTPWRERKAHPDHFEDAVNYYSRLAVLTVGDNKDHASFRNSSPSVRQSRLAAAIDWMRMSKGLLAIKKKEAS
ncbi:MAG: hypothetical protein QX199_11435 [Methylococcaceae bacterium]